MTIETELKKISKSLSLINDSQTFNKISSTNLENIDDILNNYLPLHLKWIEKGNSWIIESLSENHQLDRQAFSQLLVGVRNLYLDLEELNDLFIEVSKELDGNWSLLAGPGKVGNLPDGIKVVVRPTSKEGIPTLEFQFKAPYKIRY